MCIKCWIQRSVVKVNVKVFSHFPDHVSYLDQSEVCSAIFLQHLESNDTHLSVAPMGQRDKMLCFCSCKRLKTLVATAVRTCLILEVTDFYRLKCSQISRR